MKIRNTLLILLALCALGIISWDYTNGHSLDDILNCVYCPVCDAFHAAFASFSFLGILLLLGCIPFTRNHAVADAGVHVSHAFLAILSYRAPPASL